jgi:hypothetical protein
MSTETEVLLNAALGLCDEDRLELTEALAASLQPVDRLPFDESWLEVIRRRSKELREGTVVGRPWSEVKRRAEEKVRG